MESKAYDKNSGNVENKTKFDSRYKGLRTLELSFRNSYFFECLSSQWILGIELIRLLRDILNLAYILQCTVSEESQDEVTK